MSEPRYNTPEECEATYRKAKLTAEEREAMEWCSRKIQSLAPLPGGLPGIVRFVFYADKSVVAYLESGRTKTFPGPCHFAVFCGGLR